MKDAIAYVAESVTTPQITLGVLPSSSFCSFLGRHAQNQKEKHASAGILTSRAHPAPAERAAPRGSAAHFSGGRSGRSGRSEGSEGSDAARVDGGGSEVRSEGSEREAVDGTDRQPAAAAKTAETRTREREKRGNEDGSKGIDGSKGAIQGR